MIEKSTLASVDYYSLSSLSRNNKLREEFEAELKESDPKLAGYLSLYLAIEQYRSTDYEDDEKRIEAFCVIFKLLKLCVVLKPVP